MEVLDLALRYMEIFYAGRNVNTLRPLLETVRTVGQKLVQTIGHHKVPNFFWGHGQGNRGPEDRPTPRS